MLWIFWGIDRVKEYGPSYPLNCENCDNEVYYQLTRVRVWALLLILPIPYRSNYYLECPICGAALKLSKKERKEAKSMVGHTVDFEAGDISKIEYENKLAEFDDLLVGNKDKLGGGDSPPT